MTSSERPTAPVHRTPPTGIIDLGVLDESERFQQCTCDFWLASGTDMVLSMSRNGADRVALARLRLDGVIVDLVAEDGRREPLGMDDPFDWTFVGAGYRVRVLVWAIHNGPCEASRSYDGRVTIRAPGRPTKVRTVTGYRRC